MWCSQKPASAWFVECMAGVAYAVRARKIEFIGQIHALADREETRENMRGKSLLFKIFLMVERVGLHITPKHYYTPVPDCEWQGIGVDSTTLPASVALPVRPSFL